jgi:hypothetical protein
MLDLRGFCSSDPCQQPLQLLRCWQIAFQIIIVFVSSGSKRGCKPGIPCGVRCRPYMIDGTNRCQVLGGGGREGGGRDSTPMLDERVWHSPCLTDSNQEHSFGYTLSSNIGACASSYVRTGDLVVGSSSPKVARCVTAPLIRRRSIGLAPTGCRMSASCSGESSFTSYNTSSKSSYPPLSLHAAANRAAYPGLICSSHSSREATLRPAFFTPNPIAGGGEGVFVRGALCDRFDRSSASRDVMPNGVRAGSTVVKIRRQEFLALFSLNSGVRHRGRIIQEGEAKLFQQHYST